jgi:threonine dehydratase
MAHRLIALKEIQNAQKRIAGVAVRSPLVKLDMPGLPYVLYLKDETVQPTRSFKLRGAYNKISQLTPEQLQRGVITYSSGNHAQGVTYAARALGAKAVIVMPNTAPKVKQDATAALGAEIVIVGPASRERMAKAEELAAEHGYTMVPPYDDEDVIAGQATCGLEIIEDMPDVDVVLSPVSGGGLLSGISSSVKLYSKEHGRAAPQVWGCEPELAGDTKESFYSKKLVEWSADKTTRTIADGLRTQSLGERNFAHVLAFVDGVVTVSEDEIYAALRAILQHSSIVAEPSGVVTVAAAMFHATDLPTAKKMVAVVSGGNLDPALRATL